MSGTDRRIKSYANAPLSQREILNIGDLTYAWKVFREAKPVAPFIYLIEVRLGLPPIYL